MSINLQKHLKTWLKLLHLETFSADKLFAILAQDISLSNLEALSANQLITLGFTEKQSQHWQSIKEATLREELQWLEHSTHHLITILDDDYPLLLKETTNPPLALFVQGDHHLLQTPQLAMVGSRNPTASGAETAFEFAQYLANAGLTITSGLATGIDAASHRGALKIDAKTIAVCGTGLNRVYPAQHRELAAQIAAQGALVSEFSLAAKPQAYHFPQRNRIISGLSLGVLVVEAAQRSGSLITARLAGEQGREIFAIPGSIHNPLARGCHRLIRQGAKLVETASDVLEELGPLAMVAAPAQLTQPLENTDFDPILDKEYQQLLGCIDYQPTSVDVLIARSGMSAATVSSMLLLLELRSLVQAEAGGYRKIKAKQSKT